MKVTAVKRRLELLKLEGLGFSMPEIVTELSQKYGCLGRTVYRDFESRGQWQPELQNPRLLRISFHTFRHWKATMFYHQTKNPILTMNLLGHKKLDTTLLYIQIDENLFKDMNDEFMVKAAKTPEEVKSLLEVGFEFVCQKDDLLFFRKRK